MQAGYQYDRGAAAEALKAKLKNKKRDSVLYGAVIKTDRVFSKPTISASTNTVATSSTTMETPPTNLPPPPQPPTVGNVAERISPAETLAKRQAGLTKVSGIVDEAILREAMAKLKKNERTVAKPSTPTKQEQLAATTIATKAKLKPIDSRKPIVQVETAPPMVASAAPGYETTPDYETSSTGATTVSMSEAVRPADIPDIPVPTTILPPREPSIQAQAKRILELVNDKLKKAGRKSKKQIIVTAYETPTKGLGDDKRLKIKQRALAGSEKLIYDFSYSDDSGSLNKMDDLKASKINLPLTLQLAEEAIEAGRLNVNAATGEMTGLGFDEQDPDKIGSTRVIYQSNKIGHTVPKGKLYLMQPQLLRGHIRLYNKSGRPVLTRANVSPAFQRIAKDIVERNTFEPEDYANVDPKESADVNRFIEATKPIVPRGVNRLGNADTVWKLKKRYEVLVGELSAGNSGKLVLDEMEAILRSLIRLHAINENKAGDLIRALRKF